MKTRITEVAALRMAYLKKNPRRPVRGTRLKLRDSSASYIHPLINYVDLNQMGEMAC